MNVNSSTPVTQINTIASRQSNATRPSWAMLLCALMALGTLFVTAASLRWIMPSIVLPLCALALIGAHASPRRFARDANAPKVLRLIAFPLLFLLGNRASLNIDWFFDSSTLSFLGTLAAVEMVLQFWRESAGQNASTNSHLTDQTPQERFPAVCLLLTCAVFLAGSNTRFGDYVAWVTPVFWSLLLWALLDWRQTPARTAAPNVAATNARRKFAGGRVATGFLLLALGGGALLNGLTVRFKDELMSLGSQLIRDRLPQTAGISRRPQLGSRFEVPDSPQRILRIDGSLSGPHLRAASFDYYENGGWLPASNEVRAVTLTAPELGSDAPGPRTRITRLIDTQGNPLFAPLNADGLIPGKGIDIDGISVEGDLQSGLLRCDEIAPFRYEIIDNAQNIEGVLSNQGPFCAPLTPESRRKYLQTPPELDSRVRDLARDIGKNSFLPAQKAAAIGEYLMANHSYSREARRGEGDPVTNFLLDKRNAHCEYFASAMVILARCNDIPARYVVGYLAHETAFGERGDRGAVTVVRQRDAHAWAELWIEGIGWVTADATPGDGTPQRFGNAPIWQRVWEWAQDALEHIRERAVQMPKRTWAMIIGIPLGLWILIRARPTFGRSKTENAWQYASTDQRLNVMAARFENWMAREHWMCPPGISWRRYFGELNRSDVLGWIEQYERARFGFDHDEGQLEALEQQLNQLETPQIAATSNETATKGTP